MDLPDKKEEAPLSESHSGEGFLDAQLSLPFPQPAVAPSGPIETVIKRDGREEPFDRMKIAEAIFKATQPFGASDRDEADGLAAAVAIYLNKTHGGHAPTVDQIHDAVQQVLVFMGHVPAAFAYARYRDRRARLRRLREDGLRAVLGELEDAREEEATPLPTVRGRHAQLGVSLHDTARILRGETAETAGTDPNATDRALARAVKKEYALAEVFPGEVAEAHLSGAIHLHDMESIDRLYAGEHALEYLIRFGMCRPDGSQFAGPPAHAGTLLAQWARFDEQLGACFSAGNTWAAFNVFAAPFLLEQGDAEISQYARMTLYEAAYRALSVPGFERKTRLELCWSVPAFMRDADAFGAGGRPSGRTWGGFEPTARRLAEALMDALCESEGDGPAFPEPAIVLPVHPDLIHTDEGADFLRHTARAAMMRDNVTYTFERGDNASVSGGPAWRPRRTVWHRVSINLPRAMARTGEGMEQFSELDRVFGLAVQAHEAKRLFIEELLVAGERGPLSMLAAEHDGAPYAGSEDGVFEIAVDGLWEAATLPGGHASTTEERAAVARQLMERLHAACLESSRRRGMRFVLTANSDPATARRFAMLDAEHGEVAALTAYVDPAAQTLQYTPGAALPGPEWNAFERVCAEGGIHAFLDGNVETVLPLPSLLERELAEFVSRVQRETKCKGLRFVRE